MTKTWSAKKRERVRPAMIGRPSIMWTSWPPVQGTRLTIGESTGLIAVPSAADRQGDLADPTGSLPRPVLSTAVASSLEGLLPLNHTAQLVTHELAHHD